MESLTKKTVLTGIKPTGTPHLGNYIGAIKPALELAKYDMNNTLYFIADYHALTIIKDATKLKNLYYEVAATWLALGLDPNKVIFYRQSDVPELFELNWILACSTAKGLMNRAHAYKAIVSDNVANGIEDVDTGVNMGLYTYPILMASDILMFQTDLVPVGKDQIQHVEIARDVAQRFNNEYGKTFKLPSYVVSEETAVIPGLDGRKMSKSYGNTIPIFCNSEKLRKLIYQIKTDSKGPNEIKDTKDSTLFLIYKEFATNDEVDQMKIKYEQGISWAEVKKEVFEKLDSCLKGPREKYATLLADKRQIDMLIEQGGQKAREIAAPLIKKIRERIGR